MTYAKFSNARISLFFSVLCLLSEPAISACSQDEQRHSPQKEVARGQYIIQEENDILAIEHGSDQSYTQGLRLSFAYYHECEPSWLHSIGSSIRAHLGGYLGFSNEFDYRMSSTLGIGQNIFTPTDISIESLLEDDRPYGGYLYGSAIFDFTEEPVGNSGRYKHQYLDGKFYGQSQHRFELQLGWVGPSARAEWAQSTVHEWIDDEQPMGWGNQLPEEPGVFLEYTWRKRFAHLSTPKNRTEKEQVTFDIIPSAGIALGNVQDYLSVGLMARYGKNISGFHTDSLSPVSSITDFLKQVNTVCGFNIFVECYVFVAAEARLVAHNIFIDGSLFQNSHSVAGEQFVPDVSVGFRLRFPWRSMTLDYSYIRRGNEFNPIPSGASRPDGKHDYGMLTVKFESYF